MAASHHGPAGWPAQVPPAGVPGWERTAAGWLLDLCPADYRAHAVWRRRPVALAWIAERHVRAQVETMRDAYRSVRIDLADLPQSAVDEVMAALEAEGLRLRAAAYAAALVGAALRGTPFEDPAT